MALFVGATASVACVYADIEDIARGKFIFFNSFEKICLIRDFTIANSTKKLEKISNG